MNNNGDKKHGIIKINAITMINNFLGINFPFQIVSRAAVF
jgi:hypothetical protein